MPTTAWLPFLPDSRGAHARLFLLPPTGSDAAVYRGWSIPGLELLPVQLPGHGKRLMERPFTRMPALVSALVDGIRERLDHPFALFGHGAGALVAFEVARALRRDGLPSPERLFVAGHRAPHLPGSAPAIHQLGEEDFRAALRVREEMPEDVARHEELMAVISPILRADYELWETYEFAAEEPLGVPLHVFGGEGDETVTPAELEAWREHSTAPVEVQLLPGGRGLLREEWTHLAAAIERAMSGTGMVY